MLDYKTEIAKERDLKILLELYNKRVMTVDQISRKFGFTKYYTYKLCSKLFKSGLIVSNGIKGYLKSSGKKGSYYKVTNKAIRFLNMNGYKLEHDAESLRVSELQVPYLLTQNDIVYDLSSRFLMFDSRAGKKRYGMNRADTLRGVLSSRSFNNDYPYYLFLDSESFGDLWLSRVVREVNKYSFRNVVMFVSTAETFSIVLEKMLQSAEIYVYEKFMILPIGYGVNFFNHYIDTEVPLLEQYLYDTHGIEQVEKDDNRFYYSDMEVVELEGREFYLANALGNDITIIPKIQRYTKERYENDGREVLLVSNKSINYQEIFKNVHHIHYISESASDIMSYAKSQADSF